MLHSVNNQRTLQTTSVHTNVCRLNHKASKGLKNGAVYEIDYNAKGIPENIIPVPDRFIVGNAKSSLEYQS